MPLKGCLLSTANSARERSTAAVLQVPGPPKQWLFPREELPELFLKGAANRVCVHMATTMMKWVCRLWHSAFAPSSDEAHTHGICERA